MDEKCFGNPKDNLPEAADPKQGSREPARVTTFAGPDAEAMRGRLEPNHGKNESVVFHTFNSGKEFDMSPENIKKHLADLDQKYIDEKQDDGIR